MAGQTAAEAYEAFDQTEGIETNGTKGERRLLVKVMSEDAVGQFFRICREYDVKRRSTTRQGLIHTVMDSWVTIPDE